MKKPPCKDCKVRSDGCHNPERCAAWAEYTEQKEALKSKVQQQRMWVTYIHMRSLRFRGGRYDRRGY